MIVWLVCVLACFSLDLSCMGLSVLPGLDYFLSHIREVFNYNLFKYFLSPFFFFLFFFWDPYNSNIDVFNAVPEVSETVLNSFHSFFFICSAVVTSTILSSRLFIRSSASVILLLIPSREFLISFTCCSSLFACSLVLLGPC